MSTWTFRILTLALMAYVVWLLYVQSHRRIPHTPVETHAVRMYTV